MVVQVSGSVEAMEGNQQRVEVNILLLGARSVGKSALTVRFLTRRFIGEYGDIESVYSRVDRIDGQEICFNIWDSQDGEKTLPLSDKQLQWADGVVLVYSICDRRSFDVVRQQLQQIRRSRKPSSVPVVIVGNKRDLQRHRSVSGEEGRLLALSHCCGFFEVSAAETYHGAMLVFHRLVDLVRESRALRKSSAGVRSIVRSMSAVFGKKRAE
ncbi:ras-related and estrogen-regulated growth inhibitor-like protein [Dicentrarchus labrax]|uniref:ras-related and estrogen-regulated growth inhibitor-like protein n=1 Tax=Dicentrarchus labrax TaxID=13489 RepID=UPI001632F07B|nr:ras-related and estrogen-regulated growth inhibitor-like protein [Dicentrarchus labrax]